MEASPSSSDVNVRFKVPAGCHAAMTRLARDRGLTTTKLAKVWVMSALELELNKIFRNFSKPTPSDAALDFEE